MKISSVRVELRGAHEHVTVWVDGKNVGTLVVGIGEGERLRRLLLSDSRGWAQKE